MLSFFEVSNVVENFLFKNFTVRTPGGIAGLCVGLVAFCFLYESIICLRRFLVGQMMRITREKEASETTLINTKNKESVIRLKRIQIHIIQTVLHVIQVCFGYMLMLSVMTYNVWIALAVVFGLGFSYFVLNPLILMPEECGEECGHHHTPSTHVEQHCSQQQTMPQHSCCEKTDSSDGSYSMSSIK